MIAIRRHTKLLLITFLFTIIVTLFVIFLLLRFNTNLSFSHPSGFYDEPFTLEIHGGTAFEIYYTLDGSRPTTNSIRYHHGEPIVITDASENENNYTARTDHSTGYYTQLLKERGANDPQFKIPSTQVDKCTVIRAAVFFRGNIVSEPIFGTYFVGVQDRENYEKLYAVSLVAEPNDLFGYEQGIMVTGKTFQDYIDPKPTGNPIEADPSIANRWWFWPANYRNSGTQWERTARVMVFNENQEMEMDQFCGIRIHGGASRGFPLKSLRCYARKEYTGNDVFEVDWFGDNIHPSKFLLYSGGNDYCFNVKDYLIHSLVKELPFSTSKFIPCTLFVNGEFWGVYQIAENYNKKYIADYYNVHENNVLMVKDGLQAEGRVQDMALYQEMKDFITTADMTEHHNYQIACDLIDMNSYINYYALQIYIARNGDWPSANYALWRTVETEDSPYADGKWRWMLFDLNSAGLANESYSFLEYDSLQMVLEQDEMFASLFCNPQFQEQFADRILYIGSALLSPEKCSAFMDAYFLNTRSMLTNTNIRLYNDPRDDQLDSYINNMKQFFENRYDIIYSLLLNHLYPEIVSSIK